MYHLLVHVSSFVVFRCVYIITFISTSQSESERKMSSKEPEGIMSRGFGPGAVTSFTINMCISLQHQYLAEKHRVGETPSRRNPVGETPCRRNALSAKRHVGETPRRRNAVGETPCRRNVQHPLKTLLFYVCD